MATSIFQRLKHVLQQSASMIRYIVGLFLLLASSKQLVALFSTEEFSVLTLLEILVALLTIIGGLLFVAGIQIRKAVLLLVPYLTALVLPEPTSDWQIRQAILLASALIIVYLAGNIPHPLQALEENQSDL